ncbi:hypothetical protein EJ04DRAFT_479071 [Polyplosphaeria fusca]|uniref:Uncharacterized protein n=1 Tax=Polyplosphaeria fusca TaxID=682080 RepID=A0A9P4QLZ4_9PLEO|nr:hypothetical protein EJ04DRAFT_479071 [Polyplosphaeria fusca]
MDDGSSLRSRPRPHVEANANPTFHDDGIDQHQATSRLVEHQREGGEAKTTSSAQEFTGYDDQDIRALGRNSVHSEQEGESEPSTTTFWRGLPSYALTSEILGIIISVCFLALGICVAQLEGKPESLWSRRVIQATLIAPSIWPILFSGVLATAIRALADWQIERGISLLALEQLLGSLTMASSVITMCRWSIIRMSSAALILLWAFNPLGSQASLRIAYLQPRTGTSQGLVEFFNPNLTDVAMLSSFNMATPTSHMPAVIPALYTSTLHDLISALQYVDLTNETAKKLVADLGGENSVGVQTATDNWGNVRIPNLKYLSNYHPDDPHAWIDTPWDTQVLNYSSLVGDRIDGVDRAFTGNTTFTILSSYQDFNCSPWFRLNSTVPGNGTIPNYSEADWWLTNNTIRNLTQSLTDEFDNVRPILINIMWSKWGEGDKQIVFGQQNLRGNLLSMTKCSPRTTYVEAKVECISRGTLGKAICGVNAVRETPNPPLDPNVSMFDLALYLPARSDSFALYLLDGKSFGQASSVLEYYLSDPLTGLTTPKTGNTRWTDPSRGAPVDLSLLDIAIFERRFSILCNTLWKLSWLRQTTMGGSMSYVFEDLLVSDNLHMIWNTSSQVTFPLPSTYRISKSWLAVYFIAVAAMFFAAIFALVVRSFCCAPPILGYVSSLIRDSTYFEDSGIYKSSTENGPDKTRRLRGLKVMVADVGSNTDGVGKIAFAPMGIGERIKKNHSYM